MYTKIRIAFLRQYVMIYWNTRQTKPLIYTPDKDEYKWVKIETVEDNQAYIVQIQSKMQ